MYDDSLFNNRLENLSETVQSGFHTSFESDWFLIDDDDDDDDDD